MLQSSALRWRGWSRRFRKSSCMGPAAHCFPVGVGRVREISGQGTTKFWFSVIGLKPGQFWDNAKWEQHHKALSSDPVTMPKPLLNGLFTDARQGDSDNTIGPNGFLIEECLQTAHWAWPRPFSGGQRTLPRTSRAAHRQLTERQVATAGNVSRRRQKVQTFCLLGSSRVSSTRRRAVRQSDKGGPSKSPEAPD